MDSGTSAPIATKGGLVKRMALIVSACVLLGCGAISLAQTFPLTVKAYWTPSAVDATHSAPDSYTLTVDSGTPIIVGTVAINDVNCPLSSNPRGCILITASVASAGQHNFCAAAVNAWATSAPACVTVNISSPGTIVWVKVTK